MLNKKPLFRVNQFLEELLPRETNWLRIWGLDLCAFKGRNGAYHR